MLCARFVRNLKCAYARSTLFRYAFAAAVGKRHFSERMSGSAKTAIIEHHRSVQWAEKDYANLYTLVSANQATIQRELVEEFSDTNPLFMDYCQILKYHGQLDPLQALRRSM
jgi:hypothetical protein